MQATVVLLRKSSPRLGAALMCLLAANLAGAEDQPPEPQPIKHRVTGLFSPDRQDDLREVVESLPGIELAGIDYEHAEASFVYDPAELFAGADPAQIPECFDNLLQSVSRSTFGIRTLYTGRRDELERIEIEVVGLDCKGCSLAAYEAIYRLEGVERATVSFKEGRIAAHIDAAKTDRKALEAALRARGVQLKGE